MAQATADSQRTSVCHPLAPLTPGEAGLASRLALAAAGPGTRLVYCALAEPAKKAVMEWDGRPLPREARCVLMGELRTQAALHIVQPDGRTSR